MMKKSIIALLNASLTALKKHEDEINRLNVFPVPDGDTGTNMVHTMESVIIEVSKLTDPALNDLLQAITYGSLMGARGNSGVILSQIIKGICEEIEKQKGLSSKTIASALRNGSEVAFQAVKKPAEGTMLTVIKDMAKAADSISGNGIKPLDIINRAVEEGKKSVERTPFLLPMLKEAGVVDAGGYGLVVIGQGFLSALKGERANGDYSKSSNHINVLEESVMEDSIGFTYCTEFVLKSNGIDTNWLKAELEQLGDSMLVVGTPELTRVHIHTNDPGKVIQLATGLGSINNVQINNIIEQSKVRAESIKSKSGHAIKTLTPDTGVGIVAVANGDGVRDILLNLGVSRIVSGGQSMNPSTAEILDAVNDTPANKVLILPNNKNIILAAQQVQPLTDKKVLVIPTKSIPEAFAALLAYDKESSFNDNFATMSKAFSDVKTGEVTYAVRDDSNGNFKKNDFIGLFGGEVKTTGKDLLNTTYKLIEEMLDEDDEDLTILAGDQISNDDIAKLTETIESEFPELELDIHHGDQPVYHFIIGIQ